MKMSHLVGMAFALSIGCADIKNTNTGNYQTSQIDVYPINSLPYQYYEESLKKTGLLEISKHDAANLIGGDVQERDYFYVAGGCFIGSLMDGGQIPRGITWIVDFFDESSIVVQSYRLTRLDFLSVILVVLGSDQPLEVATYSCSAAS